MSNFIEYTVRVYSNFSILQKRNNKMKIRISKATLSGLCFDMLKAIKRERLERKNKVLATVAAILSYGPKKIRWYHKLFKISVDTEGHQATIEEAEEFVKNYHGSLSDLEYFYLRQDYLTTFNLFSKCESVCKRLIKACNHTKDLELLVDSEDFDYVVN